MPRPPSKHGLEKKFKPWRKGKSKNSTSSSSSSSLKHKLRGHERLLLKIAPDATERRVDLEAKIAAVKQEIATKESTEKERQNATKSHGIRFLERQRLVRMEKNISRRGIKDLNKKNDEPLLSKEEEEAALVKIALDQVYVAHFPHDIKYLALFRKGGVRCVDEGKTLFRRAYTRNRVLKELAVGSKTKDQKANWISREQYKRCPTSWTIEQEAQMFGKAEKGDRKKKDKKTVSSEAVPDSRFSFGAQHEQVLEAADEVENELDQEEGKKDDDKDSDDDEPNADSDEESDEDAVDPVASATSVSAKVAETVISKAVEAVGSDDSDSDSSSIDDSSSDDSSDDSSSDDDEAPGVATKSQTKRPLVPDVVVEEVDDFLMPATDDDNVFDKAKPEKNSDFAAQGDKSRGWQTQKQRPGQWKKKQRR